MVPPGQHVAEERRAQIIEAALACFTRKGYNNTTMDDIVAESGLSKGTLYWYFDSKDDLFGAALMSAFEDAGQQALAGLEQHATASEKLRVMAQAAAGLGEALEGYFSLFLEFWASSSRREEASQIWVELLEDYKDIIVGIIEEGAENGEFKPVDAKPLVWAILAAYDGLAAYLMFMPDLELHRSSAAFIETLLDGLQVNQEE